MRKTPNLSRTDQRLTEFGFHQPPGPSNQTLNQWLGVTEILLMKNVMPSFPFSFVEIKWQLIARIKNALKRTNSPTCFYSLGRGGVGGWALFFFLFFFLYKNNRRKAAAVINHDWRHFLHFYIKLVVFFPLHTQWTPVRSSLEKNRTNYASKPTNLPT